MQCKKSNMKTLYVGRNSVILTPSHNSLNMMGQSMSSKKKIKRPVMVRVNLAREKSSWDFHKGSWFAYSGDGFPGIAQGWLMTANPGGTGEAGARVRTSERWALLAASAHLGSRRPAAFPKTFLPAL